MQRLRPIPIMLRRNKFCGSMFFGLAVLGFLASAWAETPQEYMSSGTEALKANAYDRAILLYSKAIEIDPNLSKAYDNRGIAYAREGSLKRAVDDFTMAIAADTKDALAYNNRGEAYVQLGNFTQAVFDFTRAIELNAFYIKAYNNRGKAYCALQAYRKAWADVHTIEAIGGVVEPYLLGDLKKAEEEKGP